MRLTVAEIANGFLLTTAEILYRLPDYPRLLQSYIWQHYDLAPRFPKLVDCGELGGATGCQRILPSRWYLRAGVRLFNH
jgi:hypothetical protein